MIPIVAYGESLADFSLHSVQMRPVTSPALEDRLRALHCAQSVSYIGRGFNNSHHRLDGISGGPDLVVRRSLFPISAMTRRLDKEYGVLQELAHAGYPHAPRPGRVIAPHEIDGAPAFSMTFVDGVAPGFTDGALQKLGAAMRRLHALPVPSWLAHRGPTTDPREILLATWANLHPKLAAVRTRMPKVHCHRLEDVVAVLPQLIQALDFSDAPGALLHGDLGDHNFVLERKTGELFLLDWEFAAVSHPLLDLMWLFNRGGFGSDQHDVFWAAYGHDQLRRSTDRLRVLKALCLVEDAIWAQSGVDDITLGNDAGFFQPGELEFLAGEVARIHEAEV